MTFSQLDQRFIVSYLTFSSFSLILKQNTTRNMNRLLTRSVLRFTTKNVRFSSSNQQPMMLMNLPRVVYPNIFYTFKNFFSRILINGYFDPTFSIKPFSEGAKQALTVVSRSVANGQFDDLQGLVTSEVETHRFN